MKNIFYTLIICLLSVGAFAQSTVSGVVTDAETGEPLIGATVRVVDGTNGAITDLDGSFTIDVNTGESLMATFVGYASETIPFDGVGTTIDFQLAPDGYIAAVVIDGYGTVRTQEENTGAVAVVTAEEINGLPEASFDQALQGRVPGVLVIGGSGQPGANAQVRIRGNSQAPLYIVDGVPVEAADFRSLNNNDIKSQYVLKDAAAAGIYGSRGSNGVIVVETKKGRKNAAPKVEIQGKYGVALSPKQSDFLPILNSRQKIDLERELGVQSANLPIEQAQELAQIDTDWTDVLFDDAPYRDLNFGIDGGSEYSTYRFGLGYYDQEGSVINSGLNRYTLSSNLSFDKGIFKTGLSLIGGYSAQNGTSETNASVQSPLNAMYWSNPYERPLNANGGYNANAGGILNTVNELFGASNWTSQSNGYQQLLENTNQANQYKVTSNVYGQIDFPFLEGLSTYHRAGIDYRDNQNRSFNDPTTTAGQQATGNAGSISRSSNKRREYTIYNNLKYDFDIAETHDINVGLHHEYLNRTFDSFSLSGFGFVDTPFENFAGVTDNNPDFIPAVNGGESTRVLSSFFGTLDYGFNEKVFVSLLGRLDRSSKLPEENRSIYYGSASASWLMTNESFLENSSVIDFLKLRASYGITGDEGRLGTYPYQEIYSASAYNAVNGFALSQLPNASLVWPAVRKANLGVDFEILDSRLGGTIEVYNELTQDLVFGQPISYTTGFTELDVNIGENRNRGVDLFLGGAVLNKEKLFVELTTNLNYNKNEWVSLPDDNADIAGTRTITRVGESRGTNYVVPYVGVNPANGDALYLTEDGEVTNNFSLADQQIFGTRIAPWKGGFGFNGNSGNLTFSTLFSWAAGNQIFNNERTNLDNPAYIADNLSQDFLRMWRQPGDITDVPRFTNTYQTSTSRYIEDGDYVRFKNFSVGYDFADLLPDNAFSKVNLYVQGNNIFTWTDFSGIDPDIYNGNAVGAFYPAFESYYLGLDLKF